MNDSISRQAAIEAIKEDKIDLTNLNVVAVFKATGDFEKVETQVMTCNRHIEILKDLPSAQPERKRGKWNTYCHSDTEFMYSCNSCGYSAPYQVLGGEVVQKKWNFCPNCGADMRGEADE